MLTVRLMLLFAVIFWGWSFVATKIVLEYMTPVEVTGLRLLIGLPVLALIIISKKTEFKFKFSEYRLLGISSIILAAHFVIQITGIIDTSATNTGWIISVTPAVIVLLSIFFLKEKIRSIQLLGIAVATLGILALVSRGELTDFGWMASKGDWLVLGSAFTWAIYTIVGRNISRTHNPIAVTFVILAGTTILIWAYMLFTTDFSKFTSLSTEAILALLFLGIPCQAIAFWFWQEGVAKLGASKAGFFLYLEPLATTMLAVPYLGEHFGLYSALGGLLVLAGVYLTERK